MPRRRIDQRPGVTTTNCDDTATWALWRLSVVLKEISDDQTLNVDNEDRGKKAQVKRGHSSKLLPGDDQTVRRSQRGISIT